MYIKLGTTNIKYLTDQDDFMIFSEVVDSGLSYERPVLVRTSDELDIWFGRSFSDRDYLAELLESGVTLFLYKPIADEVNDKGDNYIDYYSYEEDPRLYYNEYELPEKGESEKKYKLISTNGIFIDTETKLKYNIWIWLNSEYVNTEQLPQNLDTNNTTSLNNRDVLGINYSGYSGPSYVYPDYQENFYNNTVSHSEDNIDTNLLLTHLPDLNRVDLGYETLCYDLKFAEDIDFGISAVESPFVIISDVDKNSILVYFNSDKGIPNSVDSKYYSSAVEIIINNKSREEIIDEFISILNDYGYLTDKLSSVDYQTYTSFSTPVRYFYNLSGFSMTPNFYRTHDILNELSVNDRRIEFISKTIGTDDEKIKVKIEKATNSNDYYRITISRFNYSEVFEGSIFDGLNRIDFKINNESNLVRCDIKDSYTDENGNNVQYKLNFDSEKGERDSSLPAGEWYLKRGEKEEYNPKMYWKAVKSMFNDGDTVPFDFFLVPNIKNYTSGLDPDYDYYKEYLDFLNYSKLIDCQILIQNSDSGWTFEIVDQLPTNPKEGVVYQIPQSEGGYRFYILNDLGQLEETVDREIINTYGNDYVFNYTEDVENRLVYFFRPMTVLGNPRPAYYLYLSGLLNDTYSISTSRVLYNSPVKDPYNDDEEVEKRLERYKSNYLSDNNQIYYYKKYQNGSGYTYTNWMRFAIGKVGRELEKNKGKYLGERFNGNIRVIIEEILDRIYQTFTIIRRITLDRFREVGLENKLELTIGIYMSDLINNNISLDITLNYNK